MLRTVRASVNHLIVDTAPRSENPEQHQQQVVRGALEATCDSNDPSGSEGPVAQQQPGRSKKHRSENRRPRKHSSSSGILSPAAVAHSKRAAEGKDERAPRSEGMAPTVCTDTACSAVKSDRDNGETCLSQTGHMPHVCDGPTANGDIYSRSSAPFTRATTVTDQRQQSGFFRVFRLFGATFPRLRYSREERSDGLSSPLTHSSLSLHRSRSRRRQPLCDAAMDSLETTQRRKSSIRLGSTTIREISPYAECADRRKKPAVRLTLVLTVTTLLCTAVAWLLVHRTLGSYRRKCSSASCERASRDMDMLIDYRVDPCYDFYAHVCDRWTKAAMAKQETAAGAAPATYLGSVAREFLKSINATLSILASAPPLSTEFHKLALFYRSCERFVSAPIVSLSDMLRRFQKYGDEIFDLSTFTDILGYVVKLALRRGIVSILDIRLNTFPDGVFLRILRGQTLSQKIQVNRALPLRNYLAQVLVHASEIQGRELNLSYVLEVEQRFQAYVQFGGHEGRRTAAVFQNLTGAVGSTEWFDLLNRHLPEEIQTQQPVYNIYRQHRLDSASTELL
ncbi:hypothetical protein HPB50_005078 [Hyalomma asiaticum]|uniref:Uncharacterized protein n=1 Tax=Hyalomma asiaticum TaxID=266040 RepID=A0ACB7SK31_HYAAI|nr:hypothetical protein HPB50_005078 [Hyalomma asiaticum]